MTPNEEAFEKALAFITRPGIENLVAYLKNETDWFTAPASTQFHGNYPGGLLEHSLNVVRIALHNFNFLVKYKPDLEYLRESVVIAALFHDVCKTNYYTIAVKKKKDDNSKWVEYDSYKAEDKFPFGHGEKSAYIIQKFMTLTDVEALAIRWHMGATEASIHFGGSPQSFAYYQSMENPLVRLVHVADMISLAIEDKREPILRPANFNN